MRIPPRPDAAVLEAIQHVRQDPWLDVRIELVGEMHDRDASAAAIEVERRVDGRVSAADHDGIATEGFVPFPIEMRDMRQRLTRHVEQVRRAEVSRGDDDGVVRRLGLALGPALARHDELRDLGANVDDRLVLAHGQVEVLNDRAIIAEGIATRGLVSARRERQVADGELLGRREELRIERIARDTGADAGAVVDRGAEARALERDARPPGRTDPRR